MKDVGAGIAAILAVAIGAVTSSCLAQQAGTNMTAQENAEAATSTKASVGFGDQSASHAWEMSSINASLEGKLDSKTAKVGGRVELKTIDKVQTSDGTFIPRGSHLVGHITAVQAYDRDHGGALLAIAFDHVEMKGGGSVAIFTLIRGALPGVDPAATNIGSMGMDDGMGAPMGGGGRMGGQGMGSGRNGGGVLGNTSGAVNGAGGMADGTVDRTAGPAGGMADQTGAMVNPNTNGAVLLAGHGEVDTNPSAHKAAAERAMPRPTGIPGVMLSGNSTASGVFSASRGNIHFDSGTQIQLGIVASE